MDYYVTSAVTHKIAGGPFPDYETAQREAERQRQQSIGGYGRFNIVTVATVAEGPLEPGVGSEALRDAARAALTRKTT